MPEPQSSATMRQVSRPIYEPNTGRWYNRVRTIEPDGAGGYRVVGKEEMYESEDKKFLPVPWSENVNKYLLSKLVPIGSGALLARRRPNQPPEKPAEKLDRHRGTAQGVKGFLDAWNEINDAYRNGGNPFSGTPFDVPYHSWPGTDKPWDWSTVHPYGRDPSPRPNPDGFAPPYPEPERGGELDNTARFAGIRSVDAGGSDPPPATLTSGSTLPPRVAASGDYLRANSIPIVPRTVYMAHVIAAEGQPQMAAARRRTTQPFSHPSRRRLPPRRPCPAHSRSPLAPMRPPTRTPGRSESSARC